ncbi:MAG: DNA polymerase III subunit gamma/tau [Acidiferrobacterales bacterium]
MSYQVLARKYRPRAFSDVVGQQHVVRALVHALDNDRVHHAFLFTGTRGVGKTTIARILAKSLNCEKHVSSQPCGNCRACMELDEGRFVDLIEVDAASRTKVDDTRELLENVQYASMRGRYKVYLVDEVHMLSGHSFNALLKTLEEPPPHVKFLLATTDPQKLPMTVLSRCLQFNLKRLLPELISGQLRKILEAEALAYEEGALQLLARAADGSMRDALSLLDQAIAFGGGEVKEGDVREMLGTIDQDAVERLLQALDAGDAKALLEVVSDVSEHSSDYDAVLEELLLGLHRISLAQTDPALLDERDDDTRRFLAHAQALTPEDVQLYYQIGLIGRRDLALAPDPRTGLEMILLRMLAFRPTGAAAIEETPQKAAQPDSARSPKDVTAKVAHTEQSWADTVSQLNLNGLVGQIASNSILESYADGVAVLVLDESCAQLCNKEREAVLQEALERFFGAPVRLTIRIGQPMVETPAQERLRLEDTRQQAAIDAIYNDPNVKTLQERFNARVNPNSIRPKV